MNKERIIELEKYFKNNQEEGVVDIVDFVRIFLNLLPHRYDETFYITLASIDLFKSISEDLGMKK